MAPAESEFQTRQRRTGLKGKLDDTKEAIWNPDKGEFIGRTGKSWAKIGLFYLIYYICLAGFFSAMLAVFFHIVDDNHPRLDGKDSLLKGNPGMGFRPMPLVTSTLIRFEQGKPSSYKVYTDHIQAFIDQYENDKQVGENFIDCAKGKTEEQRQKVCRFNIDDLGGECVRQNDYGYDEGQPCVLLKLNKIFGWQPEPFDNDTRPEFMGDRWSADHVGITCEGENPADRENIGNLTFTPRLGFPNYYYPYLNQEGYRAPLIFVKFNKPANGMVIQIWCKAWAKNVYHHKNDKAGSVHFELLVD